MVYKCVLKYQVLLLGDRAIHMKTFYCVNPVMFLPKEIQNPEYAFEQVVLVLHICVFREEFKKTGIWCSFYR